MFLKFRIHLLIRKIIIFSPEKTVSEDVYEEEELLQNPDEEIPGLKAASSTMSVSSVFSISGKVVLPEGK